MNWTMALWGLGGIAFFGLTLGGLGQALPPLLAYAVASVGYHLVLLFAAFQGTSAEDRHILLTFEAPSTALTALAALPVIVMAFVAMVLNDVSLPVPAYLLIAIAALGQGVIGELFWRGALIPQPDRRGAMLAFALGTCSYLPLVFAAGLSMFGGPFVAVLGGAVLTAISLILRMRTGHLGAAIAMQVASALFVFTDLAAHNRIVF